MELSTFIFFMILIPLIVNEMGNIGVFLYTLCVTAMNFKHHNQELDDRLDSDEDRDSNLQTDELNQISSKEPSENLLTMKISTLPPEDSTKNLLTKEIPATGLTTESCSTEIDDTNDFFQDTSSGKAEDLDRLLLIPETFRSIENSKGFETPVTLSGLTENEFQNGSFVGIPVGDLQDKTVMEKASDFKIFTVIKSEEVVYVRPYGLETSVEKTSCPCSITNKDSLEVRAISTELEVDSIKASDTNKQVSVEVEFSHYNASSKSTIPSIIVEDTSDKCTTGNLIEEVESDGINPTKSTLDIVPIEFFYPCLPHFNP